MPVTRNTTCAEGREHLDLAEATGRASATATMAQPDTLNTEQGITACL